MYQPVPLNWMAGAESSLCTSCPHVGQTRSGASENFRITSNRPQRGHWYSYSGTSPPKMLILAWLTATASVEGAKHQDHDRHDQEDLEQQLDVRVQPRHRIGSQHGRARSELAQLRIRERRHPGA